MLLGPGIESGQSAVAMDDRCRGRGIGCDLVRLPGRGPGRWFCARRGRAAGFSTCSRYARVGARAASVGAGLLIPAVPLSVVHLVNLL